ncbi:type II secretion system minor pseudopilin GspJ [Stutzerimonas tarimensis]|uniref:Type II secretion system protein J n=1 Tax=Stutzerimonas tarimensis TaxID=1507735 RepID=A0ABV7T5H2_9GAMM
MPRQAGFTLLELLIAIALFALLGLGTYRMLDAVLRSDAATLEQEQALRELSRAVWAFERDILHASPRPVRDGYGEEQAAFVARPDRRPGDPLFEFTRGGWRNPTGLVRSDYQRVGWRLSGDRLERLYWVVLDRDVGSQPRVQSVLSGVRELQVRFQDEEAAWHEEWPPFDNQRGDPEAASERMPRALQLSFEHPRYGRIERLLRLPDGPFRQPAGNPFEGVPEGVQP